MRVLMLSALLPLACVNPTPLPTPLPPPPPTPVVVVPATSDELCGVIIDAVCERAKMCADIDPVTCRAGKVYCPTLEGITPVPAAICLEALSAATCSEGLPAACRGIASHKQGAPAKTPIRILEL